MNVTWKDFRLKHITVLICTHNRASLLEKTLASLNQAYRPSGWHVEILVIANACTDSTHTLLENYKNESANNGWLPLTLLVEVKPGKSNALNYAIPKIQSDIIAFEDDDQRVDNNYLASICAAADAYPDATMFCGRILPDWDGSESDWFHDTGPYRVYPFPVPSFDEGDTPHSIGRDGPIPGGGNLFIRKEVIDRVGGFSVELGPKGHNLNGGEDIDFVLRALNSGEQLVYIPDIMQYHHVDPDRLRIKYLMKKSFLRSRDGILVHRYKHNRVPAYMWNKLSRYILLLLRPFQWRRKRFYLMRIAATLGEIRGIKIAIQTSQNGFSMKD